MAFIKLALPVAFLLCGFMLIGSIQITEARDTKFCPQFCYEGIEYMTCLSTGSKHLKPVCNCCLTSEKGCAIYLSSGQVVNCS